MPKSPKAMLEPEAVAPEVMRDQPAKKELRYRGMESRLHLARSAQNEWVYFVEANTPYPATLRPDYWAAFSAKFNPYDKIEVRCEDGSWIGYLRVIDSGQNWLRVVEERPIFYIEERPGDRAVNIDGHTVKWQGSVDRWTVIRDNDRAKLMAGFATRDAAMTWLNGHLKAMAA